MVSTCPLMFNSSSHFTKTLEIILSAPITFGIAVTFMFQWITFKVFECSAINRDWGIWK